MNSVINGLESEKVFYFFEQISKIPRGSGDEKGISDYLVKFAKERNLEVYQDSIYNVVIKKDASNEYFSSPTVAIQSHIDMVCEKNKSKVHDFEKDPLTLIYDDEFIRADETTLGADNGIGVAMAMAILDSDDIKHPAIEAIFTTYEEVGMDGATELNTDILSSKILINLDSEQEGIFTSGCAGGMKASIKIPIDFEENKKNLETYLLSLIGLRGGHSGISITKERGNSNKLLGRALRRLDDKFRINISKISGGEKDNAIPREAEAIISFDKSQFNDVIKEVESILSDYKKEYRNSDSNISLSLDKIEFEQKCFSHYSKRNILNSIMLIPNGVETMSCDIDGLPESSNNLGVIRTYDGEVEFICAIRSSSESKKYNLFDQLVSLSELCNGVASYRGDYPEWEYNPDSIIREKAVALYNEIYGVDPKIDIIHAGLECGIFYKKMKDLDIISFGPNFYDIHTPREKAEIKSINRVWIFLIKLLENIGENRDNETSLE